MQIFVTLGILIIVILVVQIRLKQVDRKSHRIDDYLNVDREANFSARREIEEDLYIIPNTDIITLNIDVPDDVEREKIFNIMRNVNLHMQKKMLYFPEKMDNITLKEKYGVQNLEEIIQYENNLKVYINDLNELATILLENELYDECERVLEEAIECHSDFSETYILLVSLYYQWDRAKYDLLTKRIFTFEQVKDNEFLTKRIRKEIEKRA